MARSFSQSLLAAAVAAVVGGSALAQGSLQEAVTALRVGKKDDAQEKLRAILASDPSNADAMQLYQSISQDEWWLLMTHKNENGEASDIQKIAITILERAKIEQKVRSRDDAAIRALVDKATALDTAYGDRQSAITKLVLEHGEFAVPALVEKLGNKDDAEGQIQAVFTLSQLRSAAVLPLIEATKSSNEQVVQNAAAALHLIGDDRAIPAMAHLANDDRQGIRTIATKFLAKKNVSGNAVDLMVAQAGEYLKGNVPLGGYSSVVWSLKDDKLVATDVAAPLYPSELAKAVASDAVRIAPSSLAARSLLSQAYIGQVSLIEQGSDESLKALGPVAAELKNAALSLGKDAVTAALEASVKSGNARIAVEAVDMITKGESVDTIDQGAMIGALNSSDKKVRYSAAAALVRAGGAKVPEIEKVVSVLADAVTEEAVHTIQVIAPTKATAAAVEASSKQRGFAVEASADALSGMRSLLINPGVDVVVINENLPDGMPENVIGNIKKNATMANAKIVVIAKDEAAAKARFGDGIAFVQAPLTGENLVAAVKTALEGVTTPANDRAEKYAAEASKALAQLAANQGAIGGAVANLAKQLNRTDAVAVQAARALGYGGTAAELPALLAALAGGGSLELKTAAANACGGILSRSGNCPDDVCTALVTALEGATDVGLRLSISTALAKATLPAEKRAELHKKLARIATGS
ncbi:MAG: HEAT repeat domain-containing protein [Planctomycetes bacterium]|nr:HEAT repeat domain-containing protein [Planctomycetota bacterium]